MFAGIDPGASGAIVLVSRRGAVEAMKNDSTEADLASFMAGTLVTFAVIERVQAAPASNSDGSPRRVGTRSMFNFGRSYGFLRGLLAANLIPFESCSPQNWQKAMGVIYPKGSTQTERKNIGKARAQEMFPGVKVTLAIADALLLAEHARRLHASRATP